MTAAHANTMNGVNRWSFQLEEHPDGVVLTVTAGDAAGAQMVRALGFIGVMSAGGHHQARHLALARGGSHQH